MRAATIESPWQKRLAECLPLLGHRNWIAVTDGSYPWQSSPGVETVATGADHLEVVEAVLAAIGETRHIRPVVHLDAELESLDPVDAPGISDLREDLYVTLSQSPQPRRLPHDEIIAKLDAASRTFRVLLLKTTCALPYTSVFIELDCRYWNPAAETRLRTALNLKS